MGRTLKEIIAALPEDERRRVEARSEDLRTAYRRVGLTEDLSDEWVEAIKNATMSPEYDYLNALMDETDEIDLQNEHPEHARQEDVPLPVSVLRGD